MPLFVTDFPHLDLTQEGLDALSRDLRRRRTPPFPVRFTVDSGVAYRTIDELVAAVDAAEDAGCCISDRARMSLLSRVATSDWGTLSIITPTVRELGFTDSWTYITDIHAQGFEDGFALVPPSFPFRFRLWYREQPRKEVLYMAMRAINNPNGGLDMFRVGRGDSGRLFFDTYPGGPRDMCQLDDRFAFVLP